jgi:hypothetical protein
MEGARALRTVAMCGVLALAPVGGVDGAAAAQQSAPAAQRGQGRALPPAAPGEGLRSPAEIQRMLDGYALVQAQQVLQLSEEQLPRFLTRMMALQEARRSAQAERQRIMQELRRAAQGREGSAEDTAIREQLKLLDDLDLRSAAQIRQAREGVDQALDPRQQARFRLFEENMEQRKLELLMRARLPNRGRPQF